MLFTMRNFKMEYTTKHLAHSTHVDACIKESLVRRKFLKRCQVLACPAFGIEFKPCGVVSYGYYLFHCT